MNINNTADLRTLITLLSSRAPAVTLRGVDTLYPTRVVVVRSSSPCAAATGVGTMPDPTGG